MTKKEDLKGELERSQLKWSNVKEYCDILENLRNASYQHYLRRQTYEWKMCITIWTPLVAIIGIILTQPTVHIGMVPLIIASFFILGIHIVWQLNLKKSNDLDLERVRKYEQEIKDLIGINIQQERKGKLIFQGWSHYIYVIITAGLILTAFYVNYNHHQKVITLPDDIEVWLESKHLVGIHEKEKYIIKILRDKMDSEIKTE